MAAAPTIPGTTLGKGVRALLHCVRHPGVAVRSLTSGLAGIYRDTVAEHSPIPAAALEDLVDGAAAVQLCDFRGRDGNVSLYELLVIGSLVRARAPATVVEIGTFDGNTTLQMATNAPPDARVFTLDLPSAAAAQGPLERHDLPYVEDTAKLQRRFERSPVADRVTQWLGDSATFDFAAALGGRAIDLAFVDGSHSYDYARGDTERLLPLMAPGGLVLWHDYTPVWPGVIRWLDELAASRPLRRIAGTTLVCLELPR